LQHTALHCNTPHHTASHCNTLPHTSEYADAQEALEVDVTAMWGGGAFVGTVTSKVFGAIVVVALVGVPHRLNIYTHMQNVDECVV